MMHGLLIYMSGRGIRLQWICIRGWGAFHFTFFSFSLIFFFPIGELLTDMHSTIGTPFSVAWSITTVMIPRDFPSPEKMRTICGNRAVAIRS